MSDKKNFGYLGNTFQIQLINNIITYKDFANSILEVIEPNYFDNQYFKIICQMIKEYYSKYEHTPTFDTLEQLTKSEITSAMAQKSILDTLMQIKNVSDEGAMFVQEKALKFCKQQELQKVMTKAQSIIDKGDFESYDKLEEMVRGALQVGEVDKGTSDVFFNLDEVLDDDYRHPIPLGIPGIDNLLKGGLAKGEIGVFLAPTGVGKALPISEPVLCPNGWLKIGQLNVGDYVIGSDGKKQIVTGVYPQGVRPIYKVEFTDDTFVYCDEEHLWSVNTLNMRTKKIRKKGKSIYSPDNGYITVKTMDMIKDIKKRNRYNYRLPNVSPIQFEKTPISIDPYLLGLLLGDGSICESGIRISTEDDQIFKNIEHLNEHTSFRTYNSKENKITKQIFLKKELMLRLKEYGLLNKKSNNKFIPKDFLYNSLENRVSLLQGLLDTDGFVSNNSITQFYTVSEQLSKDVKELVLSLGGTIRKSIKKPTYLYNNEHKEGQKCYVLTISFCNDIIPFRLDRKINRYKSRTKYTNQKFVKSIEYSHNEEAVCIKVSNKDELFVTRDYVLTHNTTFTTKIANHAFNLGYNVLQIFFEDNPKIIQRKHFTLWTGIHPDDLSENKDDVMAKVKHIQSTRKNKLIMKKLASDTVSMNQIKNQVRKMIAEGTKIDMIILDYIDCVVPDKSLGDEWKSEGSVMRGFEAMCHELDIAGWTATQGNRCVKTDTLVDIEGKGLIQIKDVVKGDKILTHLGYRDITYIFPIQKQPVYKIKTKSGKEINVSVKHKFPVKDKGFLSIQSGLNVGDKLFIKKT